MGIHSNIDKLWVTDDAIWLRGCDETKAKMFIDQLADIEHYGPLSKYVRPYLAY